MHKTETILKALGDPTRLQIVKFLRGGEKCACEIVPHTNKSQPNVSLHLKVLKNAGILEERRDGQKIFYKIKYEKALRIIDIVEGKNAGKMVRD